MISDERGLWQACRDQTGRKEGTSPCRHLYTWYTDELFAWLMSDIYIAHVHRGYDYLGPFEVLWVHMAWHKNCVKKKSLPCMFHILCSYRGHEDVVALEMFQKRVEGKSALANNILAWVFGSGEGFRWGSLGWVVGQTEKWGLHDPGIILCPQQFENCMPLTTIRMHLPNVPCNK